jgi:DNA (cytosine-5)-methyltransferase 1
VRALKSLPAVDLIAAGFPCQDLSQAGRTAGIKGSRSGLVSEVFRLVEEAQPKWLLLENVSFMLSLDGGKAMEFVTRELKKLGYVNWAYRVVDSRAFGLPQRRQRVIFLASRAEDPRTVLFADEAGDAPEPNPAGRACGFYWTEGIKGLGWAIDAVPTLKGGSTIGIPSPPGIWMPDGRIVTPSIRDAERLQGFPADWTAMAAADPERKNGPRWKLVGNAVSVPVGQWVGKRLAGPGKGDGLPTTALKGPKWPRAAWCIDGEKRQVQASLWPVRVKRPLLAEFLLDEPTLLSARASAGFLKRAKAGSLNFPAGFLRAVEAHLAKMELSAAA